MTKVGRIGSLLGCLALLVPLGALADSHEEERGAISDVWVMAPKHGMEAEFHAAIVEHMAFRKEQGEPRNWNAFRVAIGHHPQIIMYRSDPMSWADQDTYLAADLDALDDDWNENVHPYVDHYHHYLESYDWENSHWPEGESTQGPYFTAVARKWKVDAGPRPNEARGNLSQVAKNDGWAEKGYDWLWVNRIGGEPVQTLVFSAANYADMAPTGEDFSEWLAESVGSEEAAGQMIEDWLSGFSAAKVTVWEHAPDLSTPADEEDAGE